MSNKLPHVSIKGVRNKVDEFLEQIEREYFVPFFESLMGCYSDGLYSKSSPVIRVKKIITIEDLNEIPNQRGFYLVFTDYKSGFGKRNKCSAAISDNPKAKVIYRGESYNVRTRLESHLFHDTYHKNLKRDPSRNDRYTVCLKMDDDHVNLDKSSEVSKAQWYVAYHGFPNSNRVIREIAESAFDRVFNKPIFSKD